VDSYVNYVDYVYYVVRKTYTSNKFYHIDDIENIVYVTIRPLFLKQTAETGKKLCGLCLLCGKKNHYPFRGSGNHTPNLKNTIVSIP